MIIRRYTGSNTQEVMKKVKMDLGSEAVILNTRKMKKRGLLHIFSKPVIEILAAVEDEKANGSSSYKRDNFADKNGRGSALNYNYKQDKNKFVEKEENIKNLENKINNIELTLQKFYDKIQNTNNINIANDSGNSQNINDSGNMQQINLNLENKEKVISSTKSESKNEENGSLSKILNVFSNNLRQNEVENELVDEIIAKAKEKLVSNSSISEIVTVLYRIISDLLGKPEPLVFREDGKPTVIAFVGPTGVGKTTTLAKIAAHYSIYQNKKVGLITADTYRIAAVEQLKTYAEIMGMPVSVVYSPEEIKEAINQHSDKDIIFIDTAGRSHRNKHQFEELKRLIDICEPDEIYLLINSSTSMKNCRDIIKNYDFLKEYKLIFTKADETQMTGIILNVRHITGRKLSYLTTGQSVPDDIEVVDIAKVTKKLLGSMA